MTLDTCHIAGWISRVNDTTIVHLTSIGQGDMSNSSDDEDNTVEEVVGRRERHGTTEYLIKWRGYEEEDDGRQTWEPEYTLDCEEQIEAFNKQNERKRKREMQEEVPEKKTKTNRGFNQGFTVDRIVGGTLVAKAKDEPGELFFIIKWVESDEAELIPAKVANIQVPQAVIKFYEERMQWCKDDLAGPHKV